MRHPSPAHSFDLAEARCGQRLKIVSLKSDSTASMRLRELGFCESAEVCKVTDCGSLICRLLGVRVAIARDLAKQVLVEPLCN
jgi:Fe2+ transport system protein FeoA